MSEPNKYIIVNGRDYPLTRVVNDCDVLGLCVPVAKGESLQSILRKLCAKINNIEIPTQVQADWNATQGVSQILNKPFIPSQYTDAQAISALTSILSGEFTTTGNTVSINQIDWSKITNVPALGLQTEEDPVWTLEKVNYYTKTETDTAFYPLHANPAGYLTGFTETDAIALTKTITINGETHTLGSNPNFTLAPSYTTENAQDDIGLILSSEFTYNDAAPSIAINQISWSKITGAPAFLTSYTETDPIWASEKANYFTKTQSDARYLQSFTETDPIFLASAAHTITSSNITNWNTAYGWGNHASAGYALASAIPTNNNQLSNGSGYITSSALTPYLTSATAASTYQPIGTYATASNSMAFTNKTGNISQWTNDAGYLTSSSGLSQPATQVVYGTGTGVTSSANYVYDATNVRIGLGMTPTNDIDISKTFNGNVGVGIKNPSTGTSAGATFQANNGTYTASYGILGTGYGGFGMLAASEAYLYTDQNINFMSNSATGILKFATGGNAETMRLNASGELQIGSATDLGAYKLQVTGSSIFTGSITASSALARGAVFSNTLVASANNDVLVGLDVAPAFTNGSFTGVTNLAARFTGNIRASSLANLGGLVYAADAAGTLSNTTNLVWDNANTQLNVNSTAYAQIEAKTTATANYAVIRAVAGSVSSNMTAYPSTFPVAVLAGNAGMGSGTNYVIFASSSVSSGGTGYIAFSPGGYQNEAARFLGNKRFLIGSTTDAGAYTLQNTGNFYNSGLLNNVGSFTAVSALARGAIFNNTLIAAANNDVMVGVDVVPVFTNGAFTGVANYALRVQGKLQVTTTTTTSHPFPSMTQAQRTALTMTSANDGDGVYQTDAAKGVYVYKDGVGWVGQIVRAISSISATTTIGSAAFTDYIYFCNGTFSLTQPTAVSNTNRYTYRNTGSGSITLNPTGAETINGASSLVIPSGNSIDLQSDGTGWWTV
jgi:hypothetical protein